MPTKTQNRKARLEELEGLADEIGKAGEADDSVISSMLKGMNKGIEDIRAMLKGDDDDVDVDIDVNPEDEDEPEGESSDEMPDEEDEPDDAGFEDLYKSDDDQFLDVEPLIRRVDHTLRKGIVSRQEFHALRKQVRAMRKSQKRTIQLLEGILQAQATTTAPLAKGLASLADNLSALPAQAPTRRRYAPKTVDRFGGEPVTQENQVTNKVAAMLKGLEFRERGIILQKALHARVINEPMLRNFNRFGVFDEDSAANSATAKALEKFIEKENLAPTQA